MVESRKQQVGRGAWFELLFHYHFDIDKGAVLHLQTPDLAPVADRVESEIRNLAFPEMASNQTGLER